MNTYDVDERKDWNGQRYWVVIVSDPGSEPYEIREFWEQDENTEETAYGWAEAYGYEYQKRQTIAANKL